MTTPLVINCSGCGAKDVTPFHLCAPKDEDVPKCSGCGAAIWIEHSFDCPRVNKGPADADRSHLIAALRALEQEMRKWCESDKLGAVEEICEWRDRLSSLTQQENA